MPVQIVVGAQWGDEGKGKIVDLLSKNVDIVARYQGGANAGHTVVIGNKHYVLHLIPSGIFHPHVTCVIGNGVVIDPSALIQEIRQLKELNIDIKGRLLISRNAHLIMPYHQHLDKIREQSTQKIGTTGQGIGPAYVDKAMRVGIKIVDLLHRDVFVQKLKSNIEEKNKTLKNICNEYEVDIDKTITDYEKFGEQISEYVTDTAVYLNRAIQEGKRILAEGAQGTLLDVDHGTYPFVTSSNSTSGGACTGLGIPPTTITSILGVVKAYTTRVGNGPFPTELTNEVGTQLREIGREYGATTGRPRRCGWLDTFAIRYSAMINGFTHIAITKLDVLDSFNEIKVCVGYHINRKFVTNFSSDEQTLSNVVPIYEIYKGWKTPTSKITNYSALPPNAKTYIEAIGALTGTKVTAVSVGAQREQIIIKP